MSKAGSSVNSGHIRARMLYINWILEACIRAIIIIVLIFISTEVSSRWKCRVLEVLGIIIKGYHILLLLFLFNNMLCMSLSNLMYKIEINESFNSINVKDKSQ